MIEVKDILRYISPNTSFVVNLDDYRRFIEIAKLEEQERIIKLLENEEWHHVAFATRDPDDEPTKYHDGECFGCRQIALIKGEQK